jgi:hypothetical protein
MSAWIEGDRGGITPTTAEAYVDLPGDNEGVEDGAVANLSEPKVASAAKRTDECALSDAALAAPACRLTISSIVGICCRALPEAGEYAATMSEMIPTVGVVVGYTSAVRPLPTDSNDKVEPFEATIVPEFEEDFSKTRTSKDWPSFPKRICPLVRVVS